MLSSPIGIRVLGLALLLVGTLAIPARAEVRACDGVGTGGPMCPPPVSCANDAQCAGMGLGRCVGGSCADDCGSLYTCSADGDCPAFAGVTAHCQTAALSGGGSGLCLYHDSVDQPVTTLCGAVGSTATLVQVRMCFSGGSDWRQGDCDGDTVLNGVDADPCSGSVRGTIIRGPSPFCLPGRICEGTSAVCAPILRCTSDDECIAAVDAFATQSWQCLGIAGSALHVCQPSCFATAQCTVGSTADCGPFGTCVSSAGMRGFCQATAIAPCAPSCAASALNWASPNGDCDGDGAENACDTHVCSSTMGDPHCVANASVCTALDAGVITMDGGGVIPDASVAPPDAGNTPDASSAMDAFVEEMPDATIPMPDATTPNDAESTMDGGGSGIDANTTPIPPGLGFGGGGGCRCSTPGRASRPYGAMLVMLVIAGIVRRRSPRRLIRR